MFIESEVLTFPGNKKHSSPISVFNMLFRPTLETETIAIDVSRQIRSFVIKSTRNTTG